MKKKKKKKIKERKKMFPSRLIYLWLSYNELVYWWRYQKSSLTLYSPNVIGTYI